jgi:D-amino peptidase
MTTLQDLDESFAAVFLVGQHGMAGHSDGTLSHTWLPKSLLEMRLNGSPIGEIGLNALLAGYFNVPIALVSGDSAACAEARELLGDIEVVCVKQSISRQSARLLHPEVVRRRLRDAASRAIHRLASFRPYRPPPPLRIELRWSNPMLAQLTAMIPGAWRTGPCTVAFEGQSAMEVYRFFFTATSMSFAFEDLRY